MSGHVGGAWVVVGASVVASAVVGGEVGGATAALWAEPPHAPRRAATDTAASAPHKSGPRLCPDAMGVKPYRLGRTQSESCNTAFVQLTTAHLQPIDLRAALG